MKPNDSMIPLVDLASQYAAIKPEIDQAVARVIQSANFIRGNEAKSFADEFGRYCHAKAVGVGNGTDALYLAARAIGISPNDEVILPSHTFIATAEAIAETGAKCVFADIDEKTYTIDPKDVEAKITPRTRAIVAVHLYGQPADMTNLRKVAKTHGLSLIEDAAQAHGARVEDEVVGTLGHVAAFSFYPGKNLGAYGDAGAVVSTQDDIISRVTTLSDHGRTTKYIHDHIGRNSRLDELQAAILRVKLGHLESWNRRRQEIAALYSRVLASPAISIPFVAPGRTHVFHLYVVQVDDRDTVRRHLETNGVAAGIHYPIPVHLQPAFRHLGYREGSLPRTEKAAKHILSLPIFPEMTEAQVSRVTGLIGDSLGVSMGRRS